MGDEAPDDFIKYLIAIEDEEEVEDYVQDLVGANSPRVAAFTKELLSKKKLHSGTEGTELPMQNGGTAAPSKVSPKRTKTKFVSIYSAEGEARSTYQLGGRHTCECQAKKHKLISNCLSCGRVVCAQEGSGPCLFCGTLVCTNAESEVLASNTKASHKLRKKLTESKDVHPEKIGYQQKENVNSVSDEKLQKAIEHKNRLIENDRNSLSRLVIDDQSDYFATDSNQWLSTTDRKILQEKKDHLMEHKYGSRRNKKVTLDFAGRKVIEEADVTNMYDINDDTVQKVHFGRDRNDTTVGDQPKGELVNPNIQQPAPQFNLQVKDANKFKVKLSEISSASSDRCRATVRIQDRELLVMSDDGWCLSMHQPWASLLIEGIKRHEGRTWYSAHRGRLWIAAGAKKPTEQEISVVEDSYRHIVGNENVTFPSQYPTGCLLGCVDMVDCLAQEQYREKFPDGDSNSEYVFIVENPKELILRFPIKGRHKLWKMESQIHKAAKKGLRSPQSNR
ncbi:putative activating signal cointegrator 1-like [Apostichopus japonicus]|uniref:Putative activating signal cointegrator 1-like n=1 Tax=Stichopus japonicus TaxID=307972 RepID=A0A2G8KGU3_STIJA|nr:putative activating signal cointegrator 1-like [Apostichopus japonicus]